MEVTVDPLQLLLILTCHTIVLLVIELKTATFLPEIRNDITLDQRDK